MSYPFELETNSAFVERYRGTFLHGIFDLLEKVQATGVQSKLVLDSNAASFIELVLFDFILKLFSRVKPRCADKTSADDIAAYIAEYFPDPLRNRYCDSVVDLYQAATQSSGSFFGRGFSSSNSSAPLSIPVDKLQAMLSKDILHQRADQRLARYLASLLQIIVSDILVFVRRYVIELQVEVIGEAEVKTAITADRCFLSIFAPDGGAALIGKSPRSASEDETFVEGIGEDDRVSVVSISTHTQSTLCDNISMVTMTPVTSMAEDLQLDYTEQVKRLLTEETSNVRDLHTIIRLFKQPLDAILQDSELSERLFGNVDEVLIAAEAALSTLEDAIEAAEESAIPLIGDAILDLAGEAVLDVYRTYAETILSPASQNELTAILCRSDIYQRLDCGSYGNRIRNYADCFRFVLPRLLFRPLQHCWKFLEHLDLLVQAESFNSDSGILQPPEDRDILHQSISVLHPLRAKLAPYQKLIQRPHKKSRQEALEEVARLGKNLESWSRDRPLQQCATELIHEGPAFKFNHDRSRRPPSDRYILLFDTIILLCKRTPISHSSISKSTLSRLTSSSQSASNIASTNLSYTYKVKEKLAIRHANVRLTDLPDCAEFSNAFQIENYSISESSTGSSASPTMYDSVSSDTLSLASFMTSSTLSSSTSSTSSGSLLSVGHTKGSYVLLAPSPQDKQQWMYNLLWLLSKPSIDRQLDALLNEPAQYQLSEGYKFSEPDRLGVNIIFEEPSSGAIPGGPPLIRGATLTKLIERLTYHDYSDTKFMKTFATTYRSFCKPRELLKLLIERFNIPEFSNQQESASTVFIETEEERRQATEIRKFRKEYVKPVQFRVLNFIRHWLLNHSYDFVDDPALRQQLVDFVKAIRAAHLRRWVTRLLAHIDKLGVTAEERQVVFDHDPPPILYHIRDHPLGLMTMHPVELARQVTLLEFAAFAKIRPCELIGTAWTKSAKYDLAPNVMRAIDFHTQFTYWLMRNVIETKNLEERVAVCERIVDILAEFKNLNNFSGQFCVASTFSSGCIGRLHLTRDGMNKEKWKMIEDALLLGENHNKIYAQRLRMCNPPCVPFMGMWLSRLLHVEEGNRDFLADGVSVINFNKWRRTADFVTEIQQYQNQPYCLDVEPEIREFFEKLDAKSDVKEDFEDYLYNSSYEIEPRQKGGQQSPPIFPRKFEFPLTAPAPPPPPPPSASSSTLSSSNVSAPTAASLQYESRRASRDTIASIKSASSSVGQAPGSAGRRGINPRAAPLVLAPTHSFSDHDGLSTDGSRGASSSSSLPSTPFPTPPSSASIGHPQHFFATASSSASSVSSLGAGGGPPPPLPPRPSDNAMSSSYHGAGSSTVLLPPPPPQRPLPSPSHLTGSSSAAPVGMAPPLPPRSWPPLPPCTSAGPTSSSGPLSGGGGPISAGPTITSSQSGQTRFEYPTPPQATREPQYKNNVTK